MKLAVIGGGGCAREVAWTIREAGHEFVGFVVTDLSRLGRHDDAANVRGDLDWLTSNLSSVDGLVAGIGNPSTRRRVIEEVRRRFPTVTWPAVIHPNVSSDRQTCSYAEGTVVCANVVATVNVVVGPFAMIHYGTTVGHETHIGAFSVINPGVNLAGGVAIEDEVMIGSGAVVLQYRTVGARAIVGAGAVVTKDVPAGETWAGVPAAPLRKTDA